ncbi:hypothetical protein N1030_05765 [Desulfovibrio mangrovi]|uniref:hypothetical protein n=1 Tax=Desulfovibrio mangrovi TaxID=2976983 RepID=UPI0022468783|nr:hypothetical protein [Desulfovibrio mangrovi]UZP68482.1 hypothetical protein N1030_05765 [Desulfovibrio mangrovi]
MAADFSADKGQASNAGVIENLRFGFRVWLGEIRLMLVGIGRRYEVRQLEKRLEQECALLGRYTAAHLAEAGEEPAAPSFDMIRSARQVQFLEEEILRLRQEQEQAADRDQACKRNTYSA